MKKLCVAIILLFSSFSWSRQYIQCSVSDPYSTDVMVVNLTNLNQGTLFLSSGMQNPDDERVLVNIKFLTTIKENRIYSVHNDHYKGNVAIPSTAIGKSLDFIKLDLDFNGYQAEFSCFSRIYDSK